MYFTNKCIYFAKFLTPYYHMQKDIYFYFIYITFTGNYSKLIGVVAWGLAFLLCEGFFNL